GASSRSCPRLCRPPSECAAHSCASAFSRGRRTMTRQRLQNRRANEGFDFECGSLRYHATISRFATGEIGEIFLTNTKASSQSDANARDSAIAASLALQFGCPLSVLRGALLRDERGRASSPLGVALDLIAENTP